MVRPPLARRRLLWHTPAAAVLTLFVVASTTLATLFSATAANVSALAVVIGTFACAAAATPFTEPESVRNLLAASHFLC